MAAVTVASLALGSVLLGAVVALIFDAFGSRPAAVGLAAFGLLGAAGVWGYSAATMRASATVTGVTPVWGALRVGGSFSAVGAAITALAAVAVLGVWGELTRREWGGSLAALIAFGAATSVVVAQAKDVTVLLIGLETAAACAYALVSSSQSRGSREAAFKYFVQGAIATAFFIVGMGVLVTVFVPTGDIDLLPQALGEGVPIAVALSSVVLLISALAFKAGAVPFHSWAPDAYESADPWAAAFLAAGPKVGAIAALAVLASFATTGQMGLPVVGVVTILAVLSVLVGSVTALRQRSYTRMLGYAGIAQVGYALVAVATTAQPQVAVFFICSYALATTGTFLSATAFRKVRPEWDGSIEGLAGMAKVAPLLSVCTAILVISLAGIPPLLGFWAKFVVFGTALVNAVGMFQSSQPGFGWFSAVAAVAGLAGSVVSLAYYGGVLRALYAPSIAEDDRTPSEPVIRTDGGSASWAVLAVTLAVIGIGLIPLFAGVDALLGVFR